jgi:hypothetical protein
MPLAPARGVSLTSRRFCYETGLDGFAGRCRIFQRIHAAMRQAAVKAIKGISRDRMVVVKAPASSAVAIAKFPAPAG